MQQPASHRLAGLFLSFGIMLGGAGISPHDACTADESGKPRHTNRLAKETSPYLLMHAHNPVDWYPWGPEAFAKAKKEGKLVFLSIGYSSCYWCHVMERESFENEAVAAILNKHFVAIKVDREERPDIDQVYMTALDVQGQSGGWPLSMFLTADARPVFGGTYWPREDRTIEGKTYLGFKSILQKVVEISTQKPKEVQQQADDMAEATAKALATPQRGVVLVEPNREMVDTAIDGLKESFDPVYGGFGSPRTKFRGPKFPSVCRLAFLLFEAKHHKDEQRKELLNMVTLTLDRMARGGIYDQLGGGFHRYSTERTWLVPHFEKMLYDNAQLVEVYAQTYAETKNPLYERIVRETLAYVQREMMSPAGAFYSSQDAETDAEEGRFYVWTLKELQDALENAEDVQLMRAVYGAEGAPNFEEKYYILHLPRPLAETAKQHKMTEDQLRSRLDPLKRKLFAVRSRRPQPFKNQIALTAWSGLMIAGFAEAGQALREPKYIDAARRAADFVLQHQKTKEGRLLRTYGAAPGQKPKAAVPGYLEDYAGLIHGLLSLHSATKEEKYLSEAKALTDTMIRFHGDAKVGGYYFTANDQDKLFARGKDQYDGAIPSGNSLALLNLVRLARLTGADRYRQEAEKGFAAFAGTLRFSPTSMITTVQALSLQLETAKAKGEKKQEKKKRDT